ncbi:uncharacterized protein M421DRAFT_421221 [Didymella exigua CBS 183.55]|uniref:Bet v1-like protein n=1 Tax=Didymella exigua CBS 183.55 TaxID=1150837 RepID=A0A6A5RJL9_9PLEO|nr:uncharacterized protein M421DRAFT_421221 [Didymella exigua CBS 183.55]KAF1928022.1 hypothetical protein M421DRAFT_421221 [Didymella exigua CBS 183.55]
MTSQPSIVFPSEYSPGTTDNFVSNEIIAKSISAQQIWAQLVDISQWTSYYKNCANMTVPDEGPHLEKGRVFKFSTFGFPPLTCTVRESVAPRGNRVEGRLAWESRTSEGLAIYHAWLVQDLKGDRVRILTQESQIGPVFSEWSEQKPNKMLLGHQDWLDGLVSKVRGESIGETNLEKFGFPIRQLDEEDVRKADVKLGV